MPDSAAMVNALRGTIPPDTMPFGVGGPAEPTAESAAPGMVGSVIQGLYSIPKYLMDASANAVPGLRKEDVTDNPNAPEPNQPMYNASMKSAVDLAGGGMPAAERGAAGIFGGMLSKTADLKNLDKAMLLTNKGRSEDMIRQLTGWERGAEGLWRYEIPDNKSRMMYLNANGPTGSMFNHPELFKAYPALKDTRMFSEVNPHFRDDIGSWDLNNLTVQISARNAEKARLTALHELQHATQNIEGFSPGTTPAFWEERINSPLGRELAGKRDGFDLYHQTAGEVEARNVERRADFDAGTRKEYGPQLTHDYPYANQLRLEPISSNNPMVELLRKGLRKP